MKRCALFLSVSALAIWTVFSASGGQKAAEPVPPDWLLLTPTHLLSGEGFRGVKWCTRASEIPWKWSRQCFPDQCLVRDDEDYSVFGVPARFLTYTTRNSVLYGVRVDFEGRARLESALRQALKEYPPQGGVIRISDHESRWSTPGTSLWAKFPETASGLATLYLWGRDRKFPDDSVEPRYLCSPPALNSHPQRFRPRRYTVYRAPEPVKIDGKLDDQAWRQCHWSEEFEDHQAPYAPPPWKRTRVKILYDDEYLYFGAELEEENVWASMTRRDSVVYYENDFEIFVDPEASGARYFEFEINCLNTAFDMFHENNNYRGALADPTYDIAGVRHAVHVRGTLNYHFDRDEGWSVEVRWPLAELRKANPSVSLPIRPGDTWRMNFSRVQYLHVYHAPFPYLLAFTNPEDWVWQSTHSGDLHVPEMWGKAVFAGFPAGNRAVEELETGADFRNPPAPAERIRPSMVRLPAAHITVGPDPIDPIHSPAHEADVPEFWMDRYEVTVGEFTRFLNQKGNEAYWSARMGVPELCGIVREGPGRFSTVSGREHYPVVYVTPEAAAAYCTSLGKILPTEVMWERAARGPEGRVYPWGNEPIDPSRANYDFHYGGTIPVGSLSRGATPEGIYDMAGNVKEWTRSMLRPYPGGRPFTYHAELWFKNPLPDDFRVSPVNRGGGWTTQEKCMPAAYRDSQGDMNAGFRCAALSGPPQQ